MHITHRHRIMIVVLAVLLLFTGAAAAASITNSSVTDTNALQTVEIYTDLIPVTPGGPTAPVAVPYQITLTAAVTKPGAATGYYWQTLSGGSWVRVADGQNYQPTLSTPGNYTYRFVAIGKAGQEVQSPTITVDAGYAPTAAITIPAEGAEYNVGDTINITALAGGTDATYTFDFGTRVESFTGKTGTVNAQSEKIYASATYQTVRDYKTITLTVTNRYGTAASDTVHVMYGKQRRPAASSEVTPVDTSGLMNLIEDVAPQSVDNQMPDITGFIKDLTKPFTDVIGEWFWLLLFAVPFLIMWIRQKNLLIPSILGVLFAAWLLVFLPGTAMKATIGIIILAVAGGIYGLYVRTHRT